MAILHLDWETRSDLDLTKVGLYVYSRGRHTDIWCGCYAFGEEPVEVWVPGQPVPERIVEHIESGGEVWAHSAEFEQEINNNIAIRKYAWPYIYTSQLVCTKAMAFAMGLPGTLEGCAVALNVAQRKDMEGSRLMKQMCQPKERYQSGDYGWEESPDKLERLIKYCAQDVEVERAIGHKLMRLSAYEKRVWELDQKINARGIAIDFEAVNRAFRIVSLEKDRMNEEIFKISNGAVQSCTKVAQIKKFIENNSELGELKSIAKAEMAELLGNDSMPEVCRAVLELREQAGKASTAKLEAMLMGVSSQDMRLRGCFQYSGANTRRWAGRRIQLQNLKRPSLKQSEIENVFKIITYKEAADARNHILLEYGSPISVIGDCIRGFLVAAPHHQLIACDFNAIEARVLAWLAGEALTLKVFASGQDPYIFAAADIFQKPMGAVTAEERQIGKVAVLALGYGGGVGALQAMAKGYGVALAPAYDKLFQAATGDQKAWAERCYADSKLRLAREEFMASELTKQNWRQANPNIVAYWAALEEAATQAVRHPGQKFSAGAQPVLFTVKNNILWCRLPSGGVISYPFARVEAFKTPWGQMKEGLTYMSEDSQTRSWIRFRTFGGSLAENITQAVARDLLADALLRLEAQKYFPVAHIHDEVVVEVKLGWGSVEQMVEIMCQSPEWAKTMPIAANGWQGPRYKKA